jgi:pSer/pThr/pTyr-binding forkhead associated (FHA) protein
MDVELLVVEGQPRGKALHFPPGEFLFGRGPECHVRSNSDWINRQHCLLRVTSDTASIRDLGSSTGTLVNGRRVVGEQTLTVGDRLQLGPVVLEMR